MSHCGCITAAMFSQYYWSTHTKSTSCYLRENAENMYYFSALALTLNELEDGVGLTDSRLRPDQRLMEEGRWDEANSEKQRLEEKQRAVRRRREAEASDALDDGMKLKTQVWCLISKEMLREIQRRAELEERKKWGKGRRVTFKISLCLIVWINVYIRTKKITGLEIIIKYLVCGLKIQE